VRSRDDAINVTEALARLGLEKGATLSDVRKAYRRLSLKHHPDRVQGRQEKLDAQRRFIDIKAAYDFLRSRPRLLHHDEMDDHPYNAAEDTERRPAEEPLDRRHDLHIVQSSPIAELVAVLGPGLTLGLLALSLVFLFIQAFTHAAAVLSKTN